MADPLSVLFKRDPGRRVAIGGIVLDATVEESHQYDATVTDHPVEEGGFVTDHVYENPRMVTVSGEITDSPVTIFSILNGLSNRRIEAKDQLLALYELKEIVVLVTGLEIYTDMVMQSLSFPRNQETGQRLQFTAEFKQVKFVASEVVGVAADKADPAVKDKVSENRDFGRQETGDLTDPQNTKAEEKSEELEQSYLERLIF